MIENRFEAVGWVKREIDWRAIGQERGRGRGRDWDCGGVGEHGCTSVGSSVADWVVIGRKWRWYLDGFHKSAYTTGESRHRFFVFEDDHVRRRSAISFLN